MLSTLVHAGVVFALAAHHVAASMQIATPTLTQCQDATISYSGGSGHYGLYVVPSKDLCANSVVNIPEQTGTSYKWNVNIPAGSQVELLVEDSTGAEAWSGVITVNNSSDSSCVDPKAAQALAVSSSSSSTSSSSTGSPYIPTTTVISHATTSSLSASGITKTVAPATPSAAGKAAGSPNSGLPGAILPPRFLLGIAAFLFTVAHL